MVKSPQTERVTAAYWDTVADRYLELFRDELKQKPFDTTVLSKFARQLPRGGSVCDAGCGPCGHVTRRLAYEGVNPVGVDFSKKCIELARTEQPDLRFDVMDMTSMAFADASFDGVVCYYALHYAPKSGLTSIFTEFARVLRPGGSLLIAAKEGRNEGWIDDPMGSGVKVYWSDFLPEELQKALQGSGFDVVRCEIRDALPEEINVRRIYLWATRK